MDSQKSSTINPKDAYLKRVYLTSDVYAACLQHALTTENEEVMGMLVGEINNEQCTSRISASIILYRSDKQPDRVEISPEQLLLASNFAEDLAKKLKENLRVIGWYHSHPHITVWPSHVDLKTQEMYQLMDPLFVGLIFSVYQNGKGIAPNHVQLTCFQSIKDGPDFHRREIELEIENTAFQKYNFKSIVSLPRILAQEEGQRHGKEVNPRIQDIVTTVHNDALKTMILADIVAKIAKPLYEDLDARLKTVKLRIQELEEVKRSLTSDSESE